MPTVNSNILDWLSLLLVMSVLRGIDIMHTVLYNAFLDFHCGILIQILRDYLKPKIEQNASLQEVDVDEKTRLSCLVSAVAICHVIISHKVQLDVEDYHKLFKTLSLWSDNEVITCSAFNKLLRSFPDAHLR